MSIYVLYCISVFAHKKSKIFFTFQELNFTPWGRNHPYWEHKIQLIYSTKLLRTHVSWKVLTWEPSDIFKCADLTKVQQILSIK